MTEEFRLPKTAEEEQEALTRYRELYAPHRSRPVVEGSAEEFIAAEMMYAIDHIVLWCPVCGEHHDAVTACKPAPDPPQLTGLLGTPGIESDG